jgi:hypothetical protein
LRKFAALPSEKLASPPTPEKKEIAMNRIFAGTALLAAATALFAQQAPPSGPPKSPTVTESGTFSGKTVSITYSSPRVNGRAGHIFAKDGLLGHDSTYPVWRAGANAATILHTEIDLLDATSMTLVPKGDYSLFVDVSDPANWVLIINKQTGQSGTVYDKAQDLVRTKMVMDPQPKMVENLKYTLKPFAASPSILELDLAWENRAALAVFLQK